MRDQAHQIVGLCITYCRLLSVVVKWVSAKDARQRWGENVNSEDVRLYLERANLDLRAAQANLDEGFYGVAISRAYYAMLYAVSGLLASRGLARSKHSAVHAAFGQHFVKTGAIEPLYYRMLKAAFQGRTDSDYDAGYLGDADVAALALRNAAAFVQRIEGFLKESPSR
jgi:uncharacterized protein (UPF0332 family)